MTTWYEIKWCTTADDDMRVITEEFMITPGDGREIARNKMWARAQLLRTIPSITFHVYYIQRERLEWAETRDDNVTD